MKDKYWIEIISSLDREYWYWHVKCINGKVKAYGNEYTRKCLCVADAKAFAEYTGLEIR
jgi:hypothetical protein